MSCVREDRFAAAARRSTVESDDPPRPARELDATRPRVIVLGWDGADWSLLDRLATGGKMPNLARLVREGRTARLQSFVPLLSPIIWTTLATGVDPEEHGVLDFQEIDRESGALGPISGASRRTPAVWNVASAAGRRVGVVGWWATHPAEEVDGFFVSDRAGAILFEGVREGIAFPTSLEAGVREVIDTEDAIPDSDLAPYLRMSKEELAAERRRGGGLENPVAAMARILAATRTIQRVARDLYDRERPELTAVYFEGTDAVGHVFASYVPPRLPCVSEEDFRRYSGAVEAYYVTIDRLLGQWMRRAEADGATLLLCSDHGFKWEEDRSCTRSSQNWTTAAYWHRPAGVLTAWGARVEPSPTREEASVFDLAPTIAALLGLPQDPKMTGQALTRFFRGVSPPPRRGVLAQTEVRRVVAAAPTEAERSEYAERLRALGYLSGAESRSVSSLPAGRGPGRTEGAWNNLGLYQREKGRLVEAEGSFREALRVRPDYAPPVFNLAVMERNRGNWPAGVALLFRALEAGHADPEDTILQWVLSAEQARKPEVAAAVMDRGRQRYPGSEKLAFEHARRRFEANDCGGALQALAPFSASGARDTLNLLGVSELCLGRVAEARRYFERSLALDPAQPAIRDGLQEIDRRSR
jgi:predicted AlkP superfamily phosphohydrolase/phosphomutase/Tfp pilus assembly protein PilF